MILWFQKTPKTNRPHKHEEVKGRRGKNNLLPKSTVLVTRGALRPPGGGTSKRGRELSVLCRSSLLSPAAQHAAEEPWQLAPPPAQKLFPAPHEMKSYGSVKPGLCLCNTGRFKITRELPGKYIFPLKFSLLCCLCLQTIVWLEMPSLFKVCHILKVFPLFSSTDINTTAPLVAPGHSSLLAGSFSCKKSTLLTLL